VNNAPAADNAAAREIWTSSGLDAENRAWHFGLVADQ
jgi:hypothetical protein